MSELESAIQEARDRCMLDGIGGMDSATCLELGHEPCHGCRRNQALDLIEQRLRAVEALPEKWKEAAATAREVAPTLSNLYERGRMVAAADYKVRCAADVEAALSNDTGGTEG